MLDDVAQAPYTTSQLVRLHSFSRKYGSKRLKRLVDAGHMQRCPTPFVHGRGKPEYIYHAKGKPPPRDSSQLAHALAVTEFKVHFLTWLHRSPTFSGIFLHTRQIGQLDDGHLIPDGVYTIQRNNKALLYFLEIDLGTEPLTGRGYTLDHKLQRYAQFFDSGCYQTDLRWLGNFRGFRLTVVLNSDVRLAHLQSLIAAAEHDFVLLSTMGILSEHSVAQHIWANCFGHQTNLFGAT